MRSPRAPRQHALKGIALAAVLLAGCVEGATTPPPGVTVDDRLPWNGEALPAAPAPADNATTDAKVALGRLLFYDPVLSRDKQVACATCHSEEWGMGDGLPLSVGIDGTGPTGPGRYGPNKTRRNAQTLWNAAYRAQLFWDGRASSLEDQVLFPLKEAKELGRAPEEVVADLAKIPAYVALFDEAFPGASPALDVAHLQKAIAAFERSLITAHASYDHYVEGDDGALSEASKRGMFAFAKAGCATCHAPPLFGSEQFVDRHVAPLAGVADDGRYEATKDPSDRGKFKVPTLRNVRETGPYFHTGGVDSLEDAVKHEASLAPEPVSDDDVQAITTFLSKGLIDPSRSPGRPRHVPSGLPVPVDGSRVPR